jgi:hypothetical protein
MNKKDSATVYCLKVSLKGIRPTIWRRFKVDSDITLNRLHQVLQRVMGWTGTHLHNFKSRDTIYSLPDPEWEEDLRFQNENRIRLEDVVSDESETFVYEYDFGDGWEHELKLEAILPPDPAESYPVCVAGKRNCPPEDCGGTGGYDDLMHILKTPSHPQHQEMREWLQGGYDPEAFSIMAVNRGLKRLQRKPRAGVSR